MRKRLTLAAASKTSLAIGLILGGLVLLSCIYHDGFVYRRGVDDLVFLQLDHGTLNIDTLHFDSTVSGLSRARRLYEVAPWNRFPQSHGLTQFYGGVPAPQYGVLIFSDELSTVTSDSPYKETKIPFRMLSVSLRLPVLATLLIPLTLLVRYGLSRLRRGYLEGYCRNCSYDLTGNTSGICPECGTAVAGKA